MAIEVFNRYEHKYLIDSAAYEKIIKIMDEHMELDAYNTNHKPYTIANIYYDTADDYLIRKSLSKPVYKEKLRLRSYGVPDSSSKVFLEIKKKYKGIVNKRRTVLSLDEAYSFVKSGDDTELTEFKNFVKKLNSVKDGEKGDIESFLDVDSALKYIASNTVLCNYDSYNGNRHHNFYLYENADGVFTVVPWDFNMSFGGFNGNNSTVGIDTPYISGSSETLPLIGKLLSIDEYKEKYYGYIKEMMNTLEDFEDRVTELKKIIKPYVEKDPTAFYSVDDFEKATSASSDNTAAPSKGGMGGNSSIVSCISNRLDNLKKQFSGEAEKTTEANNFGGRGDLGCGHKDSHCC